MDCTLLVNSCDAYSDLWDLYFKMLEIHWHDCPYQIVLNTESKSYEHKTFAVKTFNMFSPDSNKPISWGLQLIETLKRINTKYVISTLDDFLLEAPPDIGRLNMCFKWMEENPNISVFYFHNSHKNNIKDNLYPGFEKIPIEREYRLSCQMGLWRREKLLSYILPHETPWQWETEGTVRCRQFKDDFYTVEDESKMPRVFTYHWGGVIHRGRWDCKIIKPLNKKYNLNIDFSKRGYYNLHLETIKHSFRRIFFGTLRITGLYPCARRLKHYVTGRRATK